MQVHTFDNVSLPKADNFLVHTHIPTLAHLALLAFKVLMLGTVMMSLVRQTSFVQITG